MVTGMHNRLLCETYPACYRPLMSKEKTTGIYMDVVPGTRYHFLTVLRAEKEGYDTYYWICRCDCGKEKRFRAKNVRRGASKSCGCYRIKLLKEARTTYGSVRNPVWRAYHNMLTRCYNANADCFPSYGGRGIAVCNKWKESVDAFIQDIGPRPSPKHTLDRIDNDGHYDPDNCRWALPKVQVYNRRTTVRISHLGDLLTIPEWAERTGIDQQTIRHRRQRGWPPERIFSGPARPQNQTMTALGRTQTIAEWARELNIRHSTLTSRLSLGWHPDRVVMQSVRPRRAS
jgi:hypothetical protein